MTWFTKLFRKKTPVVFPVNTITTDELRELTHGGLAIIFDRSYKLPTDDEVFGSARTFIEKRGKFNYRPETHDCDNAAWEFVNWYSGKGWAIGLVAIDGHAVCGYVNNKFEVKLIEPQDATLYKDQDADWRISIWP